MIVGDSGVEPVIVAFIALKDRMTGCRQSCERASELLLYIMEAIRLDLD